MQVVSLNSLGAYGYAQGEERCKEETRRDASVSLISSSSSGIVLSIDCDIKVRPIHPSDLKYFIGDDLLWFFHEAEKNGFVTGGGPAG